MERFTYKGYYPKYNVLLENLPTYGFVNDKTVSMKGDLEINKMRFNTLVSGGIDVNVTEKIQVAVAASYNNSLLKESYSSSLINTSPDKFQLTPNANHINSFMEGSNKAVAQSLGLELTFRLFMK